jgi:hypothetical protein
MNARYVRRLIDSKMIETGTQKAAEAAFFLRGTEFLLVACLLHAITLAEFLDAASGVDDLLLAGIERMAGGTDFHVQLLFTQRGAGYEGVATRTGDGYFFVIGMNAGFHGNSFNRLNSENARVYRNSRAESSHTASPDNGG